MLELNFKRVGDRRRVREQLTEPDRAANTTQAAPTVRTKRSVAEDTRSVWKLLRAAISGAVTEFCEERRPIAAAVRWLHLHDRFVVKEEDTHSIVVRLVAL
tara:strand:- start:113 stop:415 length:303 start_codon:yes stop_codon:yes gene_type:complete